MTYLEGYREVCRRDGQTEDEIARGLEKAILAGAVPDRVNDQIPRGDEEAFIQRQLTKKRMINFLQNVSPEFNRQMETKLAAKTRKN